MCGFAGYVSRSADQSPERLTWVAGEMSAVLSHRGPDDSGIWVDAEAGVAFGFRRLAILDLSAAGHQPMHSASGRYVIVYNGEVYNFRSLARELLSTGAVRGFRGHSDTEVILAAIEAWGLEKAVQRFIGMFAFALWDRRERLLHLVRDRIGVKPLYYGFTGSSFLFGSELKALREHPAFVGRIDRGSVAAYMRYNYVPAPHTIYEGFHKLLPGTCLTLDAEGGTHISPYWSAKAVVEAGVENRFRGSFAEAADELDHLLHDAVGLRMVADVPLGVFLSGGIDSSTVVALMQAQSSRPVQTFTIGFHDEEYDEAVHAREISRHLGTEHTELYVTPAEALDVIPRLPSLYDEPFADTSQVPTYLVSKLARSRVTVSLSGDGGDELFGGYNRYFWGKNIWKKVGWLPAWLREAVARPVGGVSPAHWDRLFSLLAPVLPGGMVQRIPGDKLHKLAGVLGSRTSDEMYLRLLSQWTDPGGIVLGGAEHTPQFLQKSWRADLADFAERMMYSDLVGYLPDDILVKVDRASMGVSLEAREPLLDHRLVEFAWRLPLEMKTHGTVGKRILREVLYRYVPRELVERPKMGFGIPLDRWLRGPLRGWAEELLEDGRLRGEGFFDPAGVRSAWDAHIGGGKNLEAQLWTILMFQAWLAERQAPAGAEVGT